MSERKAPSRHPSTAISSETVADISYRVYLRRLQPPMTPERAANYRYVDGRTGKVTDAASLLEHSRSYGALTREYLRVLWDMGLLQHIETEDTSCEGSLE